MSLLEGMSFLQKRERHVFGASEKKKVKKKHSPPNPKIKPLCSYNFSFSTSVRRKKLKKKKLKKKKERRKKKKEEEEANFSSELFLVPSSSSSCKVCCTIPAFIRQQEKHWKLRGQPPPRFFFTHTHTHTHIQSHTITHTCALEALCDSL
jgi:hypothetical protein